MKNCSVIPMRQDTLRVATRRLLEIAVVGVAVVVILRLLNRIDLVVTPPASGGVLILGEAKAVVTNVICGITGTVLAFGLATSITARIHQGWNWVCSCAIVGLVVAWAGFEALASFSVSDQSPMRWPWWVYDVTSALGAVACLTGFSLLGFLIIWIFLRYYLADMITIRI